MEEYKPIFNDGGQVQNVGKAQEMAHLMDAKHEADKPIDPETNQPGKPEASAVLETAINDIEKGWRIEDTLMGLTPEQKWNLDVMKALKTKEGNPINTHAFIQKEGNGWPYMMLNPIGIGKEFGGDYFQGQVVIVGLEAIISLEFDKFNREGKPVESISDSIVWEKLHERLKNIPKNMRDGDFAVPVFFNGGEKTFYTKFHQYDLTIDHEKDAIVEGVKQSEKRGLEMVEKQMAENEKKSKALSNLF